MHLVKKTTLLLIALITFTHFAQAQKQYKLPGFKIYYDKTWQKMQKNRDYLRLQKINKEYSKFHIGGPTIEVKKAYLPNNTLLKSKDLKRNMASTLHNSTQKLNHRDKSAYGDIQDNMKFEVIKIDGVDVLRGKYKGVFHHRVNARPNHKLVATVYAIKNRRNDFYYVQIYQVMEKNKIGEVVYASARFEKRTKIKK